VEVALRPEVIEKFYIDFEEIKKKKNLVADMTSHWDRLTVTYVFYIPLG
jgi:hypothetical protein